MKICLTLLIFTITFAACAQEAFYYACDKSSINENWSLKKNDSLVLRQVHFPNTIHQILHENKIIGDPYYGNNEQKIKWVEDANWTIERQIDIQDIYANETIYLEFEQLEAFAQVFLNNQLVYVSNNSFIAHTIDITKWVKAGESYALKIVLLSPLKAAQQMINTNTPYLPGDERVYVRKPQYEFGWDWGPRILTTGLKKPAHIRYTPANHYEICTNQLHVEQLNQNTAILQHKLVIESRKEQHVQLDLTISYIKKNRLRKNLKLKKGLNTFNFEIIVNEPVLWWPNGMGDHTLYYVNMRLKRKKSKTPVDYETSFNYALCKIKLNQNKDSIGESFYFTVNDVPVYAKGYNIIPEDHFGPNNKQQTLNDPTLPDLATLSNANMLRVWGGGYVPNQNFYDECQRSGIMVWQDFMYACAMYPGDSAFINNAIAEANQQINALLNYNNIAVWCGNNENDEGWKNWGWQKQYQYSKSDSAAIWNNYVNLFQSKLPKTLFNVLPQANYISTSPKYGWGRKESMTHGDAHYWGVWWGKEPIEKFDQKVPRFMSEFGMQAMPDLSTLEKVVPKEKLNFQSPEFKNHQKHPTGFETLNHYLQNYLTVPSSIEDYAYATQVLQAITLKKAIEAQRIQRHRCMGTLIWQFNDSWPVCSWSVMDYYKTKKLAFHEVKKCFQNELIVVKENDTHILVHVSNDANESEEVNLHTEICDFFGKIIHKQDKSVVLKQNASGIYDSIPVSVLNNVSKKDIYMYTYINDNTSPTLYYFVPLKNLNLPTPTFDFNVSKNENNQPILSITSSVLTPYFKFANSTYLSNTFTANEPGDFALPNCILPKQTLNFALEGKIAENNKALFEWLNDNIQCLNYLLK